MNIKTGLNSEPAVSKSPAPWVSHCSLEFTTDQRGNTRHQGGCNAPLKLLRAVTTDDGRCELPILHTAGGLVGGDALTVESTLNRNSRCLITSVAAQKAYGSVTRSRLHPEGRWSRQTVTAKQEDNTDLEWLPQEMVIYADAMFEQSIEIELAKNASFLGMDIARMGRTAAGEQLNKGRWRSALTVKRREGNNTRWEFVDRTAIDQDSLESIHGLGGEPVVGSLVWAAPQALTAKEMNKLLEGARNDREGLSGQMRCGQLEQGMVARYVGNTSRDARFWFTRIWRRTREIRGMQPPRIPRYWPLQETA